MKEVIKKLSPARLTVIVVSVVLVVLVLAGSQSIIENVLAGEIHVKQADITGDLQVIQKPGIYTQWFGTVTKYYQSFETFLSKDELDGGRGADTDSVRVRFNDGGTAEISSVAKWRMPSTPDQLLKIHTDFRSFESFRAQVRQWIIEVQMQTASIFKAEETYSSRRGLFAQLITDQIQNGLYDTETIPVEEPTGDVDDAGNPIMAKTLKTEIKRNDEGKPIVVKKGIFTEYGVQLVNITLKDIDFDETIDALISQKKEAEQQRAVARANAERARQDAITAEEQGRARIAQAKADEEVEKIKAVTQAQKSAEVASIKAQQELQVAELARKRSEEEAAALLAKERAEAEANRLKVRAGLTPQEKAEVEKEIAIGVARELAKTQYPAIMNFGSDSEVNNPLDAIGYESMYNLVEKLRQTKTQ